MKIPTDLLYTTDHEWLRVEGDHAYVGITDFAQGELGDIVYVEVETVGETIDANDVFGTIEAVKTTSDLFMPLKGEILEFNEALSDTGDDNPGLVNSDCYGDGWIVKISIENAEEVHKLLDADAYKAHIGQ